MKYYDVVNAWNNQADEDNQWADLSEDEKIEYTIEACADVCLDVWRGATNERPDWLQNSYSHGCIASHDAILMRSNKTNDACGRSC